MSVRNAKETPMARAHNHKTKPARIRRTERSARPRLEVLEDRLAPAAYVVTSTADSGAGSLRYCLSQADSTSITITTPGPIQIASELQVDHSVQITGNGQFTQVEPSSPGGSFRLFGIGSNVSVTLSHLELTGDLSTGPYPGGAVENSGALTLQDCYIHDNSGPDGAGVYSGAGSSLNVVRCRIENNTANFGGGGGIEAFSASLTIADSLLKGNVATSNSNSSGGGVYANQSSSVSITGTTFQDNRANFGGGFFAEVSVTDPTATLTNCTFSGNDAVNNGGAIGTNSSGDGNPGSASLTIDLVDCTIANNTTSSGAGAYAYSTNGGYAAIQYQGTIFANNSGGNLSASGTDSHLASLGHNISTDGTGMTGTGDLGTNPQLGPLGYYGGLTPTFTLLPGPAVAGGVTISGVTTDQRGVTRPGTPSVGALQSSAVANPLGNGQFAVPNSDFAQPIGYQIQENGQPIVGVPVTFTVLAGTASFGTASSITVNTDSSGTALAGTLHAGPNAGVVTVRVTVGGGTYDFTLTIDPFFLPKLSLDASDTFINANQTFTRSGSFQGSNGPFTLSVSYGDNSENGSSSWSKPSSFVLSHVYTTEGTYTVTVDLYDNLGGHDQRQFQVHVLYPDVPTNTAVEQKVEPGQTVTVHDPLNGPGVTATLFHAFSIAPLHDQKADLILALVPVEVASRLNGSFKIGTATITTAYDVRVVNAGPLDTATVVFDYSDDNVELPTFTYFDRDANKEVTIDSSYYTVDPQARQITMKVDNLINPLDPHKVLLNELKGTVFTIAVPLEVRLPPQVEAVITIPTPIPVPPPAQQNAPVTILQTLGITAEGNSTIIGGAGGAGSPAQGAGVGNALAQLPGRAGMVFVSAILSGNGVTGEFSAARDTARATTLPSGPDTLILLPAQILTPGSAELGFSPDKTVNTDPPAPPPPDLPGNVSGAGRLPSNPDRAEQLGQPRTDAESFMEAVGTSDELFSHLAGSLLRPTAVGGLDSDPDSENASDGWQDLTVAALAILAGRPAVAPSRRGRREELLRHA